MPHEQYDNRGQVSLWESESDHPQAPKYTGTVIAHRNITEGETLSIGLWGSDSTNTRAPIYKGKITDQIKRDNQAKGPPAPVAAKQTGFRDDDVPF